MVYEYRELSEEKSKLLNSEKFENMYQMQCRFDGGARCVTTEAEDIVFKQIGFSHEKDIADEYLLDYKGWYLYIYIFLESQGSQINEVGKNYYKLSKIHRIVNISFERTEEIAPTEGEVLEVLKKALPVWNEHTSGLLKQGDKVITQIQYKGEVL